MAKLAAVCSAAVLASAAPLPDCSTTACPTNCKCIESNCESAITDCLADATCAAGQACVDKCACGDKACLTNCAVQHTSPKALAVLTCATAHCQLETAALASAAPLPFTPGVTPEAMAQREEFRKKEELRESTLPDDSTSIPDDFDSEANWPACKDVIGDIRDQSNCGCCWAFAAASAASDRLCISTNGAVTVPISATDVCFCASDDGCNGGDITSPWEHIKKGAVTGGQYQDKDGFCSAWPFGHCHHHGPQRDDPYPDEGQPGCPSRTSPSCPSKCDSTAKDPHTDFSADKWGFEGEVVSVSGADNIAKEIMKGGPVETAFTVYDTFANYSGGIYEHSFWDFKSLGGHAVRIVGFGTENGKKYWKVANSWNPHWGEKGYFRIVRGSNNCGIEDQVTASSSSAKWSQSKDIVV